MSTASSGGAAAAGGYRFEIQLAALLAVHTLAERPLRPETGRPWPQTAGWPTQLGLQTGYAVDDIAIYTQDTGLFVVQAKKGMRLKAGKDSPLVDALRQAVRMFRDGRPTATGDRDAEQSWNPTTDRILVATDVGAPLPVREHLVRVVARLATAPSFAGEDELVSNEGERTALQIFTGHIEDVWQEQTDAAITSAEFRELCSVVRVMAFDLQPNGRDAQSARAILRECLADHTQVDAAWATLLMTCHDLAADRQFATSAELRQALAAHSITAKPIEHHDQVGPVFAPEAVLRGPLTNSDLQARMTAADELMKDDPDRAASSYASVMTELRELGYTNVADQLRPQLIAAWRKSGQHAAAEGAAVTAAWLPVQRGEAPGPFFEGIILEQELRKSPGTPSRSGQAVAAILRYEAGGRSLGQVAEPIGKLVDDDAHAGELMLWLAEEAIAAREPALFHPCCERALDLASAHPGESELVGRLRIAVAECRDEWPALLATIEADCGASLYVLACARHGRAQAWRNDLGAAISSYEEAIRRGIEQHMYAEVRTWLYDLRSLRGAFYGPGQSYDPHFTAQSLPSTHTLSVFADQQRLLARGLNTLATGKHDRALRIFMRLRHRLAVGATLVDLRQCDSHLGATLAGLRRVDTAVSSYLRAGEHRQASTLIEQQPDGAMSVQPAWLSGPAWETVAAYELVGHHGDLVPEGQARALFEDLAGRLITSGPISGWSNFQANEALLKPLAALVWASTAQAAGRLIERLAPLAEQGRVGRVVEAHVDLVLGCARMHPDLIGSAAQQFADLMAASEQAVPANLRVALHRLDAAKDYLSVRLLSEFNGGATPWLALVLVELGVDSPALVDYVNAAVDRAAQPRHYDPHTMGAGTNVVAVATLSTAADAERRERFVATMLEVALDPREPPVGHCEAIDAIAVISQRCGVQSLSEPLLAAIRSAMRPLAAGQSMASTPDGPLGPLMGSPGSVILAANRLLLILGGGTDERDDLIRALLLSLIDQELDDPQLLSSALAQVPAEVFRSDLLVLAMSRSPAIRALAAMYWPRFANADDGLGERLAADPAGIVRRALAHGVREDGGPSVERIRAALGRDCRFSVRAAVLGPI
jgi:hypothetical protein